MAQLDASFLVDHFTFSDLTADNGKHQQVTMPEKGSGPTTAVNEGAVYTKVGTNPSETNLFFRAEDSGGSGGFEYQLTHVDSTKTASFATNAGTNTSGWTFLPGGLLLQYGLSSFIAAKGTATTISFPKPFVTGVYSLTIGSTTNEGNSPGENNQFIKDGSVGLISFQIVNSSSANTRFKVYWMAIGI